MAPPSSPHPFTTPQRIALGILCAAGLVWLIASWHAALSPLREAGSDFSASYVAAQVWQAIGPHALYDQAIEHARHLALLPAGSSVNLPFLTPPLTAFVLIPLTRLTVERAYLVFAILQFAFIPAGIAFALRLRALDRALVAIAMSISSPSLVELLLGQWDGLIALSLGAAFYCWSRGWQFASGVLLTSGFAFAKPQLALGVGIFLVLCGNRRLCAGGIAGPAALALFSGLAGGFDSLSRFLATAPVALNHPPLRTTVGLDGLVASWISHAGPALGLDIAGGIILLVLVVFLALSVKAGRMDMVRGIAGAVTVSLLLSPHLLVYDLVILLPAIAALLPRGIALLASLTGRQALVIAAFGWLMWNVCAATDAGNGSVGPPGRLVPWTLLIASALLCGAHRPLRTQSVHETV